MQKTTSVYSQKTKGQLVAPAAGMHFSRELLKRMELKGVESGFLTLHSGLGNYREIDVEDLTKHRMDSEEMEVTESLVEKVNATKDNGHKVCAEEHPYCEALKAPYQWAAI